jgi:hypothetical protein
MQVNIRLLLEVPQYDLRKRHFRLPKSGEFADINNYQSIGVSNKTKSKRMPSIFNDESTESFMS